MQTQCLTLFEIKPRDDDDDASDYDNDITHHQLCLQLMTMMMPVIMTMTLHTISCVCS